MFFWKFLLEGLQVVVIETLYFLSAVDQDVHLPHQLLLQQQDLCEVLHQQGLELPEAVGVEPSKDLYVLLGHLERD